MNRKRDFYFFDDWHFDLRGLKIFNLANKWMENLVSYLSHLSTFLMTGTFSVWWWWIVWILNGTSILTVLLWMEESLIISVIITFVFAFLTGRSTQRRWIPIGQWTSSERSKLERLCRISQEWDVWDGKLTSNFMMCFSFEWKMNSDDNCVKKLRLYTCRKMHLVYHHHSILSISTSN